MAVTQIGRYRVLRELGRGSGAVVYQGRDPDSGKQVAIKVLFGRVTGGEGFAERFDETLRALRRLEHPYLVPVLNYGIEQDEEASDEVAYYVVSQYMPGGTLAERIDGRPLLLSEVVPILQRLAEALDAAHSAGLLHGGLNPEQVLFDIRNRAYLTDVGLRGLLRPAAVQGTLPGMPSALPPGTPAYLSPEQILNDPLDNRADVYALGVMLFEMLTGRQPFQAETTEGLLQMHLEAPVPVLSETALARLVLPPAFNHVMERALAKNRDERYPTAGILSEAVRTTFLMAPAEMPDPPSEPAAAAEVVPKLEAAPIEAQAELETTTPEDATVEVAAVDAGAQGEGEEPPGPQEALPAEAEPPPPPPPRPLPILPDPENLTEMVREPEPAARAPLPWREWAGAGIVLLLVVLALWRWRDIRAIFISPSPTPTVTATSTPPPSATVPAVITAVPTRTVVPSPTTAPTASDTPTATRTRTRTPTRAPTLTVTATLTLTRAPTLPPFTATSTTTATNVPPTATPTDTEPPPPPPPSETPEPPPSETPVPPSATPTPTTTRTPTPTPTPT
jgi:serine/threonine-protein kinase